MLRRSPHTNNPQSSAQISLEIWWWLSVGIEIGSYHIFTNMTDSAKIAHFSKTSNHRIDILLTQFQKISRNLMSLHCFESTLKSNSIIKTIFVMRITSYIYLFNEHLNMTSLFMKMKKNWDQKMKNKKTNLFRTKLANCCYLSAIS